MDRKDKLFIIQADWIFLKFNSQGIVRVKLKDRKFNKDLTELYDKYLNLRYLHTDAIYEETRRWGGFEARERTEIARMRKGVAERNLIEAIKNLY